MPEMHAISETQISENFRGVAWPETPIDWRWVRNGVPPGGGRHFKNSPQVELLLVTPLPVSF